MTSWREAADPLSNAEQMQAALATLPVIEQAKGMIMLARTCSAENAFTALRELSQATNVKLHDVASIVVAIGSGATPPEPDAASSAVRAELRRRRTLGVNV